MTLYYCPGCGRFHDDGEYLTSHFDDVEVECEPDPQKMLTLWALKSSPYPTGRKSSRLAKPKGFAKTSNKPTE